MEIDELTDRLQTRLGRADDWYSGTPCVGDAIRPAPLLRASVATMWRSAAAAEPWCAVDAATTTPDSARSRIVWTAGYTGYT